MALNATSESGDGHVYVMTAAKRRYAQSVTSPKHMSRALVWSAIYASSAGLDYINYQDVLLELLRQPHTHVFISVVVIIAQSS